MRDLKSLKRNLELLETKGDFRLQTQAVGMLVSQVHDYVKQIVEEEAAVKQIHELERIIRTKPETPEDEKEIQEATQALHIAENLKRKIATKKASLRQLSNDVGELLKEIHKIV